MLKITVKRVIHLKVEGKEIFVKTRSSELYIDGFNTEEELKKLDE